MLIDPLKNKEILFIGYGSQGQAQALNLRDSGIGNIKVALAPNSQSYSKLQRDAMSAIDIKEGVRQADIIVMAAPDECHEEIYQQSIEPYIAKGAVLLFMHGFAIHFGFIKPKKDIDVIMVSPKGPGPLLRSQYLKGEGLAAVIAVAQDISGCAKDYAIAYALGLGTKREAMIETSFREECECDLFSEQAILCGTIPALLRAGYETLVREGYNPQLAYFECIHELKLIADLIYKHGIGAMSNFISNTAEWGGYQAGDRLIGKDIKENMKALLLEIKNGSFAEKWMAEYRSGLKNFRAMRQSAKEHESEATGAVTRKLAAIDKDGNY